MKWKLKWSEHYIKYPVFIKKFSNQPINSFSALIMALWTHLNSPNQLLEQKLIVINYISSFFAHSTYHPISIFLDNESMSSAVILYTSNNIHKYLGYLLFFYLNLVIKLNLKCRI